MMKFHLCLSFGLLTSMTYAGTLKFDQSCDLDDSASEIKNVQVESNGDLMVSQSEAFPGLRFPKKVIQARGLSNFELGRLIMDQSAVVTVECERARYPDDHKVSAIVQLMFRE